jgi:hypothetical protein
MPRISRSAGWWALGVAAAVTLACSAPSTDDAGGEDSAAPAGDYLAETYQTFDPVEFSGEGASVVDLPEGVTQGMVTVSHDGSEHFAVSALDANNESTGDLLVNTTGSYEGVTALGVHEIGGDAVRLDVDADGSWAITIAPFASAPALPESGSGDGVFLYDGPAATWAITHDGSEHFAVSAYTSAEFSMPLLVNETGAYEGSEAVTAGPALVVVQADGNWTIKAQ